MRAIVSETPCTERFVPNVAALHGLLGKLHRANGDLGRAVDAYAQSLREDSFMWDAFTDLCDSGPSATNLTLLFVAKFHRRDSTLVKYISTKVVHRSLPGNCNHADADRTSFPNYRWRGRNDGGLDRHSCLV